MLLPRKNNKSPTLLRKLWGGASPPQVPKKGHVPYSSRLLEEKISRVAGSKGETTHTVDVCNNKQILLELENKEPITLSAFKVLLRRGQAGVLLESSDGSLYRPIDPVIFKKPVLPSRIGNKQLFLASSKSNHLMGYFNNPERALALNFIKRKKRDVFAFKQTLTRLLSLNRRYYPLFYKLQDSANFSQGTLFRRVARSYRAYFKKMSFGLIRYSLPDIDKRFRDASSHEVRRSVLRADCLSKDKKMRALQHSFAVSGCSPLSLCKRFHFKLPVLTKFFNNRIFECRWLSEKAIKRCARSCVYALKSLVDGSKSDGAKRTLIIA